MSTTREYIVTAQSFDDLASLYEDIESLGTGKFNALPNRVVDCANRRPISRNTHYWLTDKEAAQIKRDPRVLDVSLTSKELGIVPKPSWSRTADFTKTNVASTNDKNWGPYRTLLGNKVAGWGSDATQKQNATINYNLSGKNVDIVIVDGHIKASHAEFKTNVNGTGDSRVNQFNWFSLNPTVTGGAADTYDYNASGGDASLIFLINSLTFHATHVAGIAAGNTHGLAVDANIYNINPYAVAGVNIDTVYDYIRAWHNSKSVNPDTGVRNPTIVNNSYAGYFQLYLADLNTYHSATITHRGTTYTGPWTSTGNATKRWEELGFNHTAEQNVDPASPHYLDYYVTAQAPTPGFNADRSDAIADGIIIVYAAGNDGRRIDNSTGLDFNNKVTYNGTDYYINRGPYMGARAGNLQYMVNVGNINSIVNEPINPDSNKGADIDIWAPGTGVVSSDGRSTGDAVDPRGIDSDQVSKLTGTSMASPQVVSVIATLLELKPTFTPAAVYSYIKSIGTTGLIDVSRATTNAYDDPWSLQGSTNLSLYAPTPTFNITTTFSAFEIGETVTYTITTTNVPDGSTVYLTYSGTAVFRDGLTQRSITINSNSATFTRVVSVNANSDSTVSLRTGGYNGTIQDTATFNVLHINLISNITLSNGTLSPSFSSNVYSYRVYIPSTDSDTVNITVTPDNPGETLFYNQSTPITSGVPFSITLTAGVTGCYIGRTDNLYWYSIAFVRTYSIPYTGLLTPPQVAVAYNLPLPTATTGQGYKIGIYGSGGDFLQSDLDSSFADLVTAGLLPAGTVAPTIKRSNPFNVELLFSGETTLDVYCVATMVPGADITVYHLGPLAHTEEEQLLVNLELAQRMINDGVDAVSYSYGWGRVDPGFFAALDAAKIPFFFAAGDYGAFNPDTGTWADYASRIANIINVGGTHLSLNTNNTRASEISESYLTDSFYSYATGYGSGGAVSANAALPSYQSGLYYTPYNTSTGAGSPTPLTHRGVPDISGPINGYVMYYSGHVIKLGGTSASAPLMAGFIIRIMELTGVKKSSTEWNEFFYSHYNSNTFYDVVSGNNATDQADGYISTVGWDPVTGLGAPNGLGIVHALTSSDAETLITKETYNTAQSKLQNILGLGENGYGLPLISSSLVEVSRTATAKQWNNLIADINIVRQHVANTNTNTAYLITGTSILRASTVTNLISDINWLYDDSRRYKCHPAQFFTTGTTSLTSTSTFFSDSTSTRTLAWGTDTRKITHEVISRFPSRLAARYYFNIGSYLSFVPYYTGGLVNDLDGEWANFIDYLRNPTREYRYDREQYINYTSTLTVWTSGSLSISLLAEKLEDEKTIKFTTSYMNNSSAGLYITPAGSTWTIT